MSSRRYGSQSLQRLLGHWQESPSRTPLWHFFATCMVALGTIISTFWILASNSWMQTPQGFEIVDGQVVPVDWLAVIFNPSFPYRLLHMTVAAYSSIKEPVV